MVTNDKLFDYVLKQIGRLDIESVDADVGKQVAVKAAASIALAVDLSVKMPYAGLVAFVDGVPLAAVGVRDIVLASRDGRIGVTASVALDLNESEPTKDKVADLVNQIVANKNITLSAGADSVVFGVSPADAVQTISKVHLDLDVTPVIAQVEDMVYRGHL
ncbi:hypothetical protein H9P43_001669 [Blastocladiella emersonii ATCC 22665]|nr:hypothetical protein H9P43_001669 [Blastocladiella emersonii ATCC 22665]